MKHNFKGNCWDKSVAYDKDGILNDVCGEHDEPRGDCSECPDCAECEAANTAWGDVEDVDP